MGTTASRMSTIFNAHLFFAKLPCKTAQHSSAADASGSCAISRAPQERTKVSNVFYALKVEDFLNEIGALRRAEDRRDQVAGFGGDFVAGHGIFRGAADIVDALLETAPSAKMSSTMATRRGMRRSNSGSGMSFTLERSRRTAGSRMRELSWAAAKVTVWSRSMTATMCCKQISGMSRLLTMAASSEASCTVACCSCEASKGRCLRRISRASRAAWMGEPTGQRLMLVRVTS